MLRLCLSNLLLGLSHLIQKVQQPQLSMSVFLKLPFRIPIIVPASLPDKRQNLVLFGLSECSQGTPRFLRNRQDLENAGELLSYIDPLVTAQLIEDCFKYQPDKNWSLLVKLTRSMMHIPFSCNGRSYPPNLDLLSNPTCPLGNVK